LQNKNSFKSQAYDENSIPDYSFVSDLCFNI